MEQPAPYFSKYFSKLEGVPKIHLNCCVQAMMSKPYLNRWYKYYRQFKDGRDSVEDDSLSCTHSRKHWESLVFDWIWPMHGYWWSHLPYSSDLAPCDFYLFPDLKKFLAGLKFASEQELKTVVEGYIGVMSENVFACIWEVGKKMWQVHFSGRWLCWKKLKIKIWPSLLICE